jgi:hypothetical protein
MIIMVFQGFLWETPFLFVIPAPVRALSGIGPESFL